VPQKVTIAFGATPNTMDPQMTLHSITASVSEHIFERLIRRSADLLSWEGVLATSWKALDDRTWEFKLREGVKFQNGEPFNAKAVKFSVDRVRNPNVKSLAIGNFASIKEVQVVDDYTIRFILNNLDATFLYNVATAAGYIVPPGHMKNDPVSDILTKEPIGTGSYKFISWTKDKSLDLEVNKDYWGNKPYFDKVSFVVIPDDATRAAALIAGDIDIADTLALADRDAVNKSGKAQAVLQQITRVPYFVFVFRSPLSLKKDFRQACIHAVDVDSIIKNVLQGAADRVPSLLAPTTFGYDANIPTYPYDVNKAKQLLAAASYAGEEIEVEGLQGRMLGDRDFSQATAGFLEAAGIKVKLNIHEWSAYLQKRNDMRWGPIALCSLGQASAEGGNVFRQQAYSKSRQWADQTTYGNPAVDKLVDEANSTYDEAKRKKALIEAQTLIYQDAAFIPLFVLKTLYGRSNKIKWQPNASEAIWAFTMGPA
jgi:peptide/nickel transport system substrate-binding protein